MDRSFEAIYRDNYERLFTLAFRLAGRVEDAEDIVQSCFLEAYRAFESFRGDSAVYTWLYRILVNCARRYRKAKVRLPIVAFAERTGMTVEDSFAYVNGFGRSEDEAVVDMVRESCLQMFMNCMPPRYRAVFTLRVILEFSVPETATILGISENAARVYAHRARKLAVDHYNSRCSLVSSGGACSCRAFASYRKELGLKGLPSGIEGIISEEQKAVGRYARELGAVLEMERLYRTRFDPGSYDGFLDRMRRLAAEGGLRILGANA
ncbi:MAG: hypothetical protein CVV47_03285 [Spirochaetae bacterium HGW-Spirochaetae-3]|jgi:RNA polymerase sigma-70 factor (ECF subfamily)|nr:MAG: hypothetical protein CVV47_03285 [Spirochaetae bacterium HGW-Spirochaetae-3]